MPTIHTVNKRLMDNFIFNYEDDNVDHLEEEEDSIVIVENLDQSDNYKIDILSDNYKIDNLNQSDKKRCLIIIQNGYRKGEMCNRICQDNMIVCGIHNYYNDKNK
jgi:hypothetical protein